MNDFTKEELFDLQSCVMFWGINGNKNKQYLNDKIQSMRDNYCEHEAFMQCHECGSFICKHCKKIYPDDNQ
jgi:hypothetical protein